MADGGVDVLPGVVAQLGVVAALGAEDLGGGLMSGWAAWVRAAGPVQNRWRRQRV